MWTPWNWILASALINHVILATCLTSLCLSFHICKMGIIMVHRQTLKTLCQVKGASHKKPHIV